MCVQARTAFRRVPHESSGFVVLLGVCAVLGAARQTTRPNGEEGRIIALESAWDQAEQNKDANALANLLAENLVYVDYDGSISAKQQFLAQVKSVDVTGEQINNEGVTVHVYGNNVAVSSGIYRDKGDWRKANPSHGADVLPTSGSIRMANGNASPASRH